MANIHEFECRDLTLQKVVVYSDRAEVSRVIKVDLHKGINEVHVKNITQKMINDSYRVSGRGAPATIHEVMMENKPASSTDVDPPKVTEMKKKLEEEEATLAGLNAKKAAVEKSINALDNLISKAGTGILHDKDGREHFVADERTFKSIQDLHEFYRKQSEQVRIELHNLEVTITKQNEIVNKANNSIRDAINTYRMSLVMRNVIIVLETKEGGSLEIDFIYQVIDASWRPSYDIRVCTSSQKPTMQISYYGHIYQKTGEDWKDVALVLTTIQAALDGSIPVLRPIEVQFRRYNELAKKSQQMQAAFAPAGMARGMQNLNQRFEMANVMDESAEEMDFASFGGPIETEAFKAEVTESTLSSEFVITRRGEIPSDGTEHKVSIGVVETDPKLIYDCVPSLSTLVYLTSSAINTSKMPFLAGAASVYLDGSFIAKSRLRNVSPGERFSCALGVDPSVRVEYKPVKKFTEEQGFVSKVKSTVNDQQIVIKNTRKEPITLILREQIPRSSDEKIRVALLEPNAVKEEPTDYAKDITKSADPVGSVGARLTTANTLNWTLNLKGAEQKNINIKWLVEYPKNQNIEFVQKF